MAIYHDVQLDRGTMGAGRSVERSPKVHRVALGWPVRDESSLEELAVSPAGIGSDGRGLAVSPEGIGSDGRGLTVSSAGIGNEESELASSPSDIDFDAP